MSKRMKIGEIEREREEGKPPPIDWAFFPTSAFNWHSPVARRGANLHGRKLHGPKGCFATKGVDTGDLSSRDAKMESSYHDALISVLRTRFYKGPAYDLSRFKFSR